MNTTAAAREKTKSTPCFRLKGGFFTLTTLQLLDTDPNKLEADLAFKVQQAPQFFANTPIVIDLQSIQQPNLAIDFAALNKLLRKYHIIPIGVKGAIGAQQEAVIQAGLALLTDTTKAEKVEIAKPTNTILSPTKVIIQPVRSGQQVYAQGGDLIVLAPVSVGAELLADGNIHVYAPLRGRALAGIHGDTSAHIFCQRLEAELVSIAGQYQLSEQLKEGLWQQAVDVSLCENQLRITKM